MRADGFETRPNPSALFHDPWLDDTKRAMVDSVTENCHRGEDARCECSIDQRGGTHSRNKFGNLHVFLFESWRAGKQRPAYDPDG